MRNDGRKTGQEHHTHLVRIPCVCQGKQSYNNPTEAKRSINKKPLSLFSVPRAPKTLTLPIPFGNAATQTKYEYLVGVFFFFCSRTTHRINCILCFCSRSLSPSFGCYAILGGLGGGSTRVRSPGRVSRELPRAREGSGGAGGGGGVMFRVGSIVVYRA